MPLITETYYLSLTQDNRGILRLRCSQDDTLRTVNLKLYNNGSIFVIPSGVSASVSGVKQNGAVFSKPCTISQNRENVVLQLSSDITNTDGIIVAEIVLNDGEGGRLGTSNFIIQVEKNPIRAGVVQDTETPIEYISDFIDKIQTLTARLNNLITPSGDPSLAEVVDARIGVLDSTTYQTLGARLNAEFQRLSNALSGVTILESTGDTTDRTSEILSKLNAYGTCKLGKGDFYVNSLIMPEGSQLVGSGNSTRIILPSSVTSGYVVKPRSNCIVENISFYGGFTGTYSELIASGASAQRHCIILDRFDSVNSENVILSNIFINNFVGSAIIQRYTVGCHCKDIVINMCYAGIDISNASYDGLCTNVYISGTRFGVVQNGSNFVFNGCISKDSAYHIMSDQQNTECTFSSCTFFDSSLETTAKLASLSNARNGFVFDNCMFDSSLSMLLNACDGIVIKGTNFVGSDTFAITVSNGRNTLLLITDCIADVEPTVTNAGTAARITSCYLKDGTAWTISEADITVDDELSDESENPVQNKVINRAIGEIKADLGDKVGIVHMTEDLIIVLNTDPVSLTPLVESGWSYAVLDCTEGDKFVINASGGSRPRAWGFVDSSNHILSVANARTSFVDLELTAPTNAVKLIINDNSGGMSYKVGNNLATKASNGLSDEAKEALLECLRNVAWPTGNYRSYIEALARALNVEDPYNTYVWSMSLGNLKMVNGGVDIGNSYSPSTMCVNAESSANYNKRRTVMSTKGKAFIYRPNNATIDQSTEWEPVGYAIPVPQGANHVKITVQPAGQEIYSHIVEYDEETNKYGNAIAGNRTSWTQVTSEGFEKDLVIPEDTQTFMYLNLRYNSSASDYPVEPSDVRIEFSEV